MILGQNAWRVLRSTKPIWLYRLNLPMSPKPKVQIEPHLLQGLLHLLEVRLGVEGGGHDLGGQSLQQVGEEEQHDAAQGARDGVVHLQHHAHDLIICILFFQ